MPSPKLSDNYKGKTFGEISKIIQDKYKDRNDSISNRGRMAEMDSLREQQETVKAKQEAQQQLQMAMQQAMNPQAQQDPMQQMQGQDPMAMQQEPMQQLNTMQGQQGLPDFGQQERASHPASQSYNEDFAYGGAMNKPMEYVEGGLFGSPFDTLTRTQSSGKESFMPINAPQRGIPGLNMTLLNSQQKELDKNIKNGTPAISSTEGNSATKINPLRYAPLLSNALNLITAKKPGSNKSAMEAMGYRTSVDEDLAGQVTPRQTQFNNVDVSQLERGINNAGRGFTQNNTNASGGNAGMFMSNELANQGNIMDSIAKARMQSSQMDRQTQQLNAGEQARIDQFLQGQNAQRTGAQQANVGIGMQLADLDARDLGAFNNNRSANMAGLMTNLGTIGKESDQMKMIGNALGYNSFGDYIASLPKDEKGGALQAVMSFLGNKG
tara:strand:+ start:10590 stop:11903 length:1314 start_codon:yes stop_codon:yes gene_type:complete